MRLNAKTDSATWLKGFIICAVKFVMGTPVQPCAEDDPRIQGFPQAEGETEPIRQLDHLPGRAD